MKENTEEENTATIVFFCDGNISEKRTTKYILGSILRQLFSCGDFDLEGPEIRILQKLQKMNQNQIGPLVDTITQFTKHFQRVTIIADGLDECTNPREIWSVLAEVATGSTRVLITSRAVIDPAVSAPQSHILLDIDMVQADIARYIEWRLTHDVDLRSIKDELKTFVKDQLLLQSFGV